MSRSDVDQVGWIGLATTIWVLFVVRLLYEYAQKPGASTLSTNVAFPGTDLHITLCRIFLVSGRRRTVLFMTPAWRITNWQLLHFD